MAETWKKLLASSVICHLISFGILLLISILTYSKLDVLPEFQWDWIVATTWSEYLRLAPVAQGWATLLVFAWVVPMTSSTRGGTSFDRFGGSIGLLLVLGVAFAVAYLVAYPAASSRAESLEFTSSLASQLKDSADEARENQNFTRALSDLNQYVVLVGESEAVEELLIEVREQARADEVRMEVDREAPEFSVPGGASAEDLLDRATAAFRREDFSTAHYMATLARSLEPENGEAARIATRSLDELARLAPDQEEVEAFRLFQRKQEAKAALTRRDYVEAYYLLSTLASEYPRDVDVQRYLETARDEVTSLAVFRDEIESALALPGAPDVVFVNRAGTDAVEIVAIGKLVRTADGIYGQRIEAIEVGWDGQVISHLSSAYGKLQTDVFVLTVLDRESSALAVRPTIHAGAPAAATEGLLEIGPDAESLVQLASVSRRPGTASISGLSRTINIAGEYGLLPEPIQLEFLVRLAAPFSFLIVSLVLMGFGWRYRSRYLHRPPLPTLILVPLVPVAVLPFYLALVMAQRILLSTVLLAAGMAGAIVLLVVIQAVLLLLSLFYLALGTRS